VTAAIELAITPLRIAAKAKMVASSAISLNTPPGTFPLRKMIEQPMTEVYTPPRVPLKSRLTIIGIPVKSHETTPGRRGKGMSKGGPRITSDAAAKAPSTLAKASILVSSLCNDSSPVEDNECVLNHIYIFCKLKCPFNKHKLMCLQHFLGKSNKLSNQVSVF